jgi:hypothetical protein
MPKGEKKILFSYYIIYFLLLQYELSAKCYVCLYELTLLFHIYLVYTCMNFYELICMFIENYLSMTMCSSFIDLCICVHPCICFMLSMYYS